jgi:phosphoserine phosphatase RsbU/P
LADGGFPLGMFECAEFQTGEVMLQSGDVLVLYSDGITEATSSAGEEFGEARLQAQIEKNAGRPLSEIQAAILEAVRMWAGDEPDDDMTLLMVRAIEAEEAREAKEIR